MAYDVKKFNSDLDGIIARLQDAEKVTKAILSDLSRQLLSVVHDDTNPDVGPINRVLDVLTPVNRKTAVLFFMHFSGHVYSEKDKHFGKRDKALYAKKAEAAMAFLEDPHNNIWSWADRNVEVEVKPFTLLKVTKFVESALKKAEAAGFKQSDVVSAMLAGGLAVEALMAVIEAQAAAPAEPVAAE